MMLLRRILFVWAFFFPLSVFPWENRESEVLFAAQKENIPIAAVFLGGKWCPWSEKLRRDVLQDPLFLSTLGKEIFLWEVSLEKEEKDLLMLQKYGVQQCPQIVLLDPKGKEFARLQNFSFDAAGDAAEILDLVESFHDICFGLGQKCFDELYWQELYLKAKKLSIPYFKQVILKKGVEQEKGIFFHLEKLAWMLGKYKLKSPQVLKIKKELIKRDPQNRQGSRFKIAVLEFQKMASSHRTHKVLRPLLSYVDEFGKKDKDHLWRAELMISEFLYAKHLLPPSLQHAQAALVAAPEAMRPKILEMITLMGKE